MTAACPGTRIRAVWRGLCFLFLFFAAFATTVGSRSGAARASQSGTAEQHIRNAKQALRNGEYNAAKDEAKRALKLEKRWPEAHLVLAEVGRAQGKHDDAVKAVKQAIKYRPDYLDAHYLHALLQIEWGEEKQAQGTLVVVGVLLGHSPKDAQVSLLKGRLELLTCLPAGRSRPDSAKVRSAIEAYDEALQLAGATDDWAPIVRERVKALRNYVGGTTRRNGSKLVRPSLLYREAPSYSEEDRRKKVTGTVKISVFINEKGEVADVLIHRGLPHGLSRQAVKAALKLRFSPARLDGKPQPYWLIADVDFNMK